MTDKVEHLFINLLVICNMLSSEVPVEVLSVCRIGLSAFYFVNGFERVL